MLTAEVFNWIGHVLFVPRAQIADALKRREANNAGIYILLGDQDDEPAAYIGRTDDLSTRVKQQEGNKFEWESAVFVTAIGNRLNTAHVRYLEGRLIERAKRIKSVFLTNGNDGSLPELSEAERSAMEEFLRYLFLVLPAIRVDMFSSYTRKSRKVPGFSEGAIDHAFRIDSEKLGITATLDVSGGEFVVQPGSLSRKWNKDKYPDHSYAREHDRLVDQGVLVLDMQSNRYKFKENYAFPAISAASSVVLGRPSSGPAEWKHIESQKTFRDWEAERVEQLPSEG